jgi:hypothetical protein
MRKLLLAMGLLAVAAPLSAQLGGHGFPAGFVVRPDDPAQSVAEISFVIMRPGWHITTGPSAILYDPALQATGSYRVDAEIFLFDPGDRLEAYGVLIGGRELSGAGQSYTYFVIRHTGEYLVRRRQGNRTETLVEWTAHPAIMTWAGRGDGATAKNVLAIEVEESMVRFLANGKEVASLPRTRVDTEGIVGLRVNHHVNLHVSSLVVTKR